SEVVDEKGVRLIHDWIRQLPVRKDERALVARLADLDEETSLAREKSETRQRVRDIARGLADAAGRKQPSDEDRARALQQLKGEHARNVQVRARGRVEGIEQILKSTSAALILLTAVDDGKLPRMVRAQALAAATHASDPQIRDLFERFLPAAERVRRLGST